MKVWGRTYFTSKKTVLILQKKALRIFHKVYYREHINRQFIKSGFLKFKDFVELQTLVFMFRAKNRILPGKSTEVVSF